MTADNATAQAGDLASRPLRRARTFRVPELHPETSVGRFSWFPHVGVRG